jgi:hypothetical protein
MSTRRQTSLFLVVGSVFLAGGSWGVVSATINHTAEAINFPEGLILAFVLGIIVAFVCSPFIGGLTLRTNRINALCWIYGITTYLICLWSIVVHDLAVLMGLSGLSLLAVAFLAWLWLPRVWTEKGRCARCGYDLRGSTHSPVCPECGTPTAHDVHERTIHTPTRGAKIAFRSSIAFTCIAFAGCFIEYHIQQSPMPFDPRLWREYPKSYYRQAMAKSFVKTDELLGLPREKLMGKLGQPDGNVDTYHLTPEIEMFVRFDANECVASVKLSKETPEANGLQKQFETQIIGKPRDSAAALLDNLEMKSSTLSYEITFTEHHRHFGRWVNMGPLSFGSSGYWLDIRLRDDKADEVEINVH